MVIITIPGEPKEQWRDVKGYEGKYQVSNLGNVRSLDMKQTRFNGLVRCEFQIKGRDLKPFQTGKGYKRDQGYLTIKIAGKSYKVHRLVAEAFLDNPNNFEQVNHIDGNKDNNAVSNLEWCNNKQNAIHAAKNGLTPSGSKSILHKLTEQQVNEIRKRYIKGDRVNGAKPLARKFEVSSTTIRKIIAKDKWRWLDI